VNNISCNETRMTVPHSTRGQIPDVSPRYAAIYARVSTEDQGEGFSIPTQIDTCQKLAARKAYTVPESPLSKPYRLGSA